MNEYTLENFIDFCNEMQIAEEGMIEQPAVEIDFFGDKEKVKVYFHNVKDETQANEMLNRFLKNKPWTNKKMWEEIYKNNLQLWESVNTDSYFDGKKVNSFQDLINAVQEYNLHAIEVGNRHVYLSGSWWIDPEHGWGIDFPNGKYVPQGNKKVKFGYENPFTYLSESMDFREYDH